MRRIEKNGVTVTVRKHPDHYEINYWPYAKPRFFDPWFTSMMVYTAADMRRVVRNHFRHYEITNEPN